MRTVTMDLQYQNYIEQPPLAPKQLWGQACSNDETTIESWRETWIDNIKKNQETHGPWGESSIGQLFNKYKDKPCIIAGSGPSLAYNSHLLKDRGEIPLVSCLHNFHYFADRGIKVDYYVSLDAGPVTVEEVSEGGEKSEEEYWEMTKDNTLLAWIGSHPSLLEKWRGKILFYNCPVPDDTLMKAQDELEIFNVFVSNGGNVLGACLNIVKAFLGCAVTAFVGADFCFGYNNKFHGWDSKYDSKMGYCIDVVDVFGNKMKTWQSYNNFKAWFDNIALTVPGIYINCTEGGTFGAYPQGNIMAVQQTPLAAFLDMFNRNEDMRACCEDPKIDEKKIFF
jgi:hypothetical protein